MRYALPACTTGENATLGQSFLWLNRGQKLSLFHAIEYLFVRRDVLSTFFTSTERLSVRPIPGRIR